MYINGKRVLSESETRANILQVADELGCKGDVIEIFNKYDRLLLNCTNQEEKKAISLLGNQELHHLISKHDAGELIVGDRIIK